MSRIKILAIVILATLINFFSVLAIPAKTKSDSLLNLISIAKEDTNKVKLLNELSLYFRVNNPDSALLFAKQSLRLSQKLKLKNGLSKAYVIIADIYLNLGNYDQVYYNYSKGIIEMEKNKDFNGIGTAYANIGGMYSTLENHTLALEYLQKALEIKQRFKKEKSIAIIHNIIGIVYGNTNQWTLALNNFFMAEKITIRIKDTITLSNIYNNIGEVYNKKKQFKIAKIYYNKSLTLAKKAKIFPTLSAIYLNLGDIELKEGRHLHAITLIKRGLKISKTIGRRDFEISGNDLLMKAYINLNEHKLAFETFESNEILKKKYGKTLAEKQIAEIEVRFKNEKFQQKLNLLSKDNEIKDLKLRENNFFIVALIGILSLVVLIAFLIIRSIKLKDKHNTLILKKRALELEQKALRAQINPHFLFNALNSIQKFILLGDEENAHEYIGKFSSLMRSILDNSDKTFIPIIDEFNAITLYLEIEQLRLKNKFEFEINTDPDIDIYNIYMPSMIIQPYVENAIWHGLVNNQREGKVKICIDKKSSGIIFSIEDNGIGINNSKDLGRKNLIGQKPTGMKLVKDRIDAINMMRKNKLDIQITDLIDSNNKSNGTKIEILMPIES